MAFEDSHRRTTDFFWLALFLCAVAAQVFFALSAAVHGFQVKELEGEFQDVLNVTAETTWTGWAQDTVTNWMELRQDVKLESKGLLAALCSAAASSGVFLLLLAYFPVHIIVHGVVLGAPAALLAVGAAALSGAAEVVGIETRLGWPFMMLGLAGFMLTTFAWQYLQLAIAVLRCSAAFIRARPKIGGFPLLFGIVHLAGLALWACAVLGVRIALDAETNKDWNQQLGIACAMLLCFLWGSAFVTGLSTFTVAYAASHWYGRGPADAQQGVLPGLKVGLRYHAGSIALGSLLLAFVRTLKIMLWWAQKAEEEAGQAAQGAVRAGVRGATGMQIPQQPRPPSLLRSVRHFAAEVLDVVATWASKQAFVQVALSGCPFATGAMRAARLGAKAPVGFLMVEFLSHAFQRACELLLLCVAVLVAASFGLEGVQGLGPVVLAAYLAAESLLHPYSVATTTILHCCLLDKDGKEPDRVPKEAKDLRRIMEQWGGDDGSFAQHYA
ncbi:unnamed protein product [Effrenium voratum]|nr:unnamed protein product [Effrenium voratum]